MTGSRAPGLLPGDLVSQELAGAAPQAPSGACVYHGIPFRVRRPAVVSRTPVTLRCRAVRATWLVFLHTSDTVPLDRDVSGFIRASTGHGHLGEHAADYVVLRADGSEETLPVRRRREVGAFRHPWGEQCFDAVPAAKPHPVAANHEQDGGGWGWSQTRASSGEAWEFGTYLWAWRNPRPGVPVTGLRLVPVTGAVVLYAVSAGRVRSHPLRWERRRKMIWRMAPGEKFDPKLAWPGRLGGIEVDLGVVIRAEPRRHYPNG